MFQKNAMDLDIRDILQYDPENGKILMNNSRVIFFDNRSLGLLRRDLINVLGFERARGFMFRHGWNRGVHNVGIVLNNYSYQDDLEWLLAGPKINQMLGVAKVEILQADIDRANGNFYMEGIWKDTYESEEYIRHFGKGVYPVCTTMTGYASGYVSTHFNRQVIFKEVKCRGMGDPYCQWIGKTVEEWGSEVDAERGYLEEHNLQDPLDEAYRKIEKQQEILQLTHRIHRKLMQNILHGGGFDDISSILSDLLELPVLIENQDFMPLAYARLSKLESTNYSKSLSDFWKDQDKRTSSRMSLHQLVEHKEPIELHVSERYGASHRRVIAPIVLKNELFGYISVISDDPSASESHLLCLERASWACSLYLFQQKTTVEMEYRMADKFLDEMLSDPLSAEKWLKQGKMLGYNLGVPGYAYLIEGGQREEPFHGRESFIKRLQSHFQGQGEKWLITERSHFILLLIPEPYLQKQRITKHEMADVLLKLLSQNSSAWKIGISSRYSDVSQVKRAYEEAKQVLKIHQQLKKTESVAAYEDLGLLHILLQHENPAELHRFAEQKLGPLLSYDQENNSELTKTLYFYLMNECNLHKTAKEMKMSVGGFRYRLKRIAELYQGDLTMAEERFQLYFALKYLIMTNQFALS
ncbi:XylR N-terminal domain-containing protein [Ammoniphilus sp. 3BR4]|uniref:XylR N-terminal domain-containing protein n=1 Tax=Ammoniphilus sp. 3BR4 TaxID=3158265 RepID=UPI003466A113